MQHDNNSYAVPDERLQISGAAGKLGMGRDIGTAEVVHTLFGKAEVRIQREQDRAAWFWPLLVLVIVAMGGGAWRLLRPQEQSEPLKIIELSKQNTAVSPPVVPVPGENLSSEVAPVAVTAASKIETKSDSKIRPPESGKSQPGISSPMREKNHPNGQPAEPPVQGKESSGPAKPTVKQNPMPAAQSSVLHVEIRGHEKTAPSMESNQGALTATGQNAQQVQPDSQQP